MLLHLVEWRWIRLVLVGRRGALPARDGGRRWLPLAYSGWPRRFCGFWAYRRLLTAIFVALRPARLCKRADVRLYACLRRARDARAVGENRAKIR